MKDESHDVEDQEQEEEEEKREEDEGQWENLADIPTNDKPVVQVIYCIPFCSGTSLGGQYHINCVPDWLNEYDLILWEARNSWIDVPARRVNLRDRGLQDKCERDRNRNRSGKGASQAFRKFPGATRKSGYQIPRPRQTQARENTSSFRTQSWQRRKLAIKIKLCTQSLNKKKNGEPLLEGCCPSQAPFSIF